jgi:hypothetical protein
MKRRPLSSSLFGLGLSLGVAGAGGCNVLKQPSGPPPDDTLLKPLEALQAEQLRDLALQAAASPLFVTYQKQVLANARALTDGVAEVRTEVDGQTWVQPPFPYQAKCLNWLRQARADLPVADRLRVDALLDATSLMAMFAG